MWEEKRADGGGRNIGSPKEKLRKLGSAERTNPRGQPRQSHEVIQTSGGSCSGSSFRKTILFPLFFPFPGLLLS